VVLVGIGQARLIDALDLSFEFGVLLGRVNVLVGKAGKVVLLYFQTPRVVVIDEQIAAVGVHQIQGVAGGIHQVAVLIFDGLLLVHFPGQQGDFLLQFLVSRLGVHEGAPFTA